MEIKFGSGLRSINQGKCPIVRHLKNSLVGDNNSDLEVIDDEL